MKKYLFLVPLVLILALAYCRYTYVLNPNWSGEESMLRIKQRGLLADPALVALSMTVTVKSIIIYWHMFLLANAAFFLCVFPKGKVKLLLILYLFISALSAFFFAIDAFIIKSPAFFMLAYSLKNFLLTPVFTATGYLVIRYFDHFGKRKLIKEDNP